MNNEDKLELHYLLENIDHLRHLFIDKNLINKVKSITPKLVSNNFIPFRIISINYNILLCFNKDSTIVYIEFYNSGRINLEVNSIYETIPIINIDIEPSYIVNVLKSLIL